MLPLIVGAIENRRDDAEEVDDDPTQPDAMAVEVDVADTETATDESARI